MAKPISAGFAGCSTRSPSQPRSENINLHQSPPRRGRRPLLSLSPSPAILSLLATISASTTYGSPTPPSFLCPSLDVPHPSARNSQSARSRGTATPSKVPRSPRSTKKNTGSTRHVPDKFEMDDNGRWRRVETYTLYGSTVCFSCRDSTTSVASVDDEARGPPSPSNPQSTPTSTADFNIHDNLPPGWKLLSGSEGRTTLILTLSLVLAFLICFLIIGCLFWRKSRRRKRKQQKDIEMKVRRQRRGSDENATRASILIAERDFKVKQKLWARATARWKANARYTARQRRGKRASLSTRINSPQNSSASLDRIEATQTISQIYASSPTASRQSSTTSLTASNVQVASSPSPERSCSRQAPVSPFLLRAPSPPAYHLRVTVPTTCTSLECQRTDKGGDRPPPSPQGSLYSPTSYVQSSDTAGNSENLPSQPAHVAHVATDDKSLLARLADLASAPPPDDTMASHGDSTIFNVSVPIWQDEELEDFGEESHGHSSSNVHPSGHTSRPPSPAPLFPPPPSKGKMAASSFYDYAFEEDAPAETDPGPSAPPFEEGPHCPLNVPGFVPSAPPLPEMEASYYASPYDLGQTHNWEAISTSEPHDGEKFAERLENQDQDTVHTNHTDSYSPLQDSIAESSIPPVHGPIARDGTPPSYQP